MKLLRLDNNINLENTRVKLYIKFLIEGRKHGRGANKFISSHKRGL